MASQLTREAELPAVFLEQTAFATVRSTPPLLRKFAHYMIYAGTLYLEQGLIQNAIYCLGISYQVYEKPNWPETLINLCSMLGSALADANDLENSFVFYKKLLEVSIGFRGEGKQEAFLQLFLKAAERLRAHILAENNPFVTDKKEKLKEVLQMHSLLKIQSETVEIFTAQDELYCNDDKRLYIGKYDMAQLKERGLLQIEQAEAEGEAVSNEGVYNKSQSWLTLGKMIEGDMSNPFENSVNPKQRAREELLRDLWFYDERQSKRKAILYTKKRRFVYAMEPIYLKFRCRNPISVNLHLVYRLIGPTAADPTQDELPLRGPASLGDHRNPVRGRQPPDHLRS